jgi:general secretion pathway protein K
VSDTADEFTRNQMRRLFTLLEIEPDLVNPFIDWIDKNDDEEPGGAETSHYNGLDRPYNCKNSPMETISELRLIKGINADIYNKVSRYLTIYPYPAKDKSDIINTINLNTADPLVIKSLDPAIDDGEVERIIQNRPYSDVTSLRTTLSGILSSDAYNKIVGHINISGEIFQISSEGNVNGIKKKIYSIVERKSTKDVSVIFWRVE